MKIYKNLVSQFQNMTPEEKNALEPAVKARNHAATGVNTD